MPVIIAYWDIRGLAQPIRLLLEYVGEEYEDKKYSCGPAPTYDRSSWLDVKPNLGLDFPNLPYFIDGDIKITQSNAILRYLGRKHGLCGKDEKTRVMVDIMTDQIMDMRNAAVRLFYSQNFAQQKDDYLNNLQKTLGAFEASLGDKKWLCGDEITFPDFHFYEMLDQHSMLAPTCLDKFPKLQAYKKRFEELPKIKSFMESSRFMKHPCNNRMAGWQG